MTTLTEDLKKLILAGIGAAAVTAEKSKEMIDQLVEKGELTVEQGKVLNEELKQEILSIDGVTDIIPSRQSLYATLKTDIYQSGGMCDMLTDQNYATVEAALTEGTMPKDSHSIVLDYYALNRNLPYCCQKEEVCSIFLHRSQLYLLSTILQKTSR